MRKSPFYSISIPRAEKELAGLHQQVVLEKGRIELINKEIGAAVIISKDELVSLEKALEILSAGDAAEQARSMLKVIGEAA